MYYIKRKKLKIIKKMLRKEKAIKLNKHNDNNIFNKLNNFNIITIK